MGFCPDADVGNRLDTEWKKKGICCFDWEESTVQMDRFYTICTGDLVVLKKREVFGKTMKLFGHGRVKSIAYDENNMRYLVMDWVDQQEVIEVPLMACNSTVDIKSIKQVEEAMPEDFWQWLGIEKMSEYNTKILKLNEIAAWWLPEAMKKDLRKDVQATLPSLQRGFVWKSSQIEMLWDSIAQGFPIGSLLLSKYGNESTTPGHGSDGAVPSPSHLILDGQQRATAIALGFRDIWTNPIYKEEDKPKEALWVDLVKLMSGERRFAFRVITKAHPWGYQRTNPNSRLSAHMARKALKQYQKLPGKENVQPHDLDLSKVFPWDSKAPVPLALLIASIREYVSDSEINDILYYNIIKSFRKSFNISQWKELYNTKQLTEAEKIITEKDNEGLKELVFGLHNALRNIEVPAPVLTAFKYNRESEHEENEDEVDENVPIFNLFKRINNEGTPLSREEINYSMLKSVWPDAREAIEGEGGLLGGGRQFAHPARMVSIITRLYIIIRHKDNDRKSSNTLQSELTISQFNARLKKDAFKDGLTSFCKVDGKVIVEKTWEILTTGNSSLPVVLVV